MCFNLWQNSCRRLSSEQVFLKPGVYFIGFLLSRLCPMKSEGRFARHAHEPDSSDSSSLRIRMLFHFPDSPTPASYSKRVFWFECIFCSDSVEKRANRVQDQPELFFVCLDEVTAALGMCPSSLSDRLGCHTPFSELAHSMQHPLCRKSVVQEITVKCLGRTWDKYKGSCANEKIQLTTVLVKQHRVYDGSSKKTGAKLYMMIQQVKKSTNINTCVPSFT